MLLEFSFQKLNFGNCGCEAALLDAALYNLIRARVGQVSSGKWEEFSDVSPILSSLTLCI